MKLKQIFKKSIKNSRGKNPRDNDYLCRREVIKSQEQRVSAALSMLDALTKMAVSKACAWL